MPWWLWSLYGIKWSWSWEPIEIIKLIEQNFCSKFQMQAHEYRRLRDYTIPAFGVYMFCSVWVLFFWTWKCMNGNLNNFVYWRTFVEPLRIKTQLKKCAARNCDAQKCNINWIILNVVIIVQWQKKNQIDDTKSLLSASRSCESTSFVRHIRVTSFSLPAFFCVCWFSQSLSLGKVCKAVCTLFFRLSICASIEESAKYDIQCGMNEFHGTHVKI